MQVPLQPLDDQEEQELEQLLAHSRSANLWYARGVFSAIACEPSLQDVTAWLPLVLGADVEDSDALRRTMMLLLRDCAVVAQCLQLGEPLLPDTEPEIQAPEIQAPEIQAPAADLAPASDVAAPGAAGPEFVQFCKGFVRVSQASKAWPKDTEASALVLPLAVTAGYLRLESLAQVLPEVGADVTQWQRSQESDLGARLLRLYTHFAAARQKAATIVSGGKIGRNEQCPCGSGRKFKKCCGAAQP